MCGKIELEEIGLTLRTWLIVTEKKYSMNGYIVVLINGYFSGFLVLVCLVLLIVLMIVRIRQHKHPTPSRKEMRTMASNARTNVRNRFTMRYSENAADNVVYASGPSKVLNVNRITYIGL